MKRIKIAAHRGAALLAPENTSPSFIKAVELGADMIEIDVRTTVDGELVIIHNSTVDGVTDGTGRVEDLTLSQVKALDAGRPFSPDFAKTRIPTLGEALETIKRLGVEVNVEIKRAPVKAVIDEIGASGIEKMSMISSPDHSLLREVRHLCPSIRILAMGLDPKRLGQLIQDLNPDALNFNRHTMNTESYGQVLGNDVTIYQSILGENDNETGIKRAVELGADILETDQIGVVVKTLDDIS